MPKCKIYQMNKPKIYIEVVLPKKGELKLELKRVIDEISSFWFMLTERLLVIGGLFYISRLSENPLVWTVSYLSTLILLCHVVSTFAFDDMFTDLWNIGGFSSKILFCVMFLPLLFCAIFLIPYTISTLASYK